MIKTDFHMHTAFSSDSDSSMESMIEQAIALDFNTICFTEHQDYDFPVTQGLDFQLDIPAYITKTNELKEVYKNKIQILTGIEVGIMSHLANTLNNLVNQYTFDFIIGSSHLVNGYDPYSPEYFTLYGQEKGIYKYFESILENISSFESFQVYGHLDYVIRYVPDKDKKFLYKDYDDIIDAILIKLIQIGKGIECNTSGLKYGLNQTHPHIDIIRRYKELGGEIITIGSDAHKPEHIGYGFDLVPQLLKSVGFEYYTIFEGRKAKFIKL